MGALFAFGVVVDRPAHGGGLLPVRPAVRGVARRTGHFSSSSTWPAEVRSPSTAARRPATTQRWSTWWRASGCRWRCCEPAVRGRCSSSERDRHGGRRAWIPPLRMGRARNRVTACSCCSPTGNPGRQYVKGLSRRGGATGVAVALTWSQLHWSEQPRQPQPLDDKQENSYRATNQGHMDEILDGSTRCGRTRYLGSASASATSARERRAGRARPAWCTTDRSRSGSSSGSRGA